MFLQTVSVPIWLLPPDEPRFGKIQENPITATGMNLVAELVSRGKIAPFPRGTQSSGGIRISFHNVGSQLA